MKGNEAAQKINCTDKKISPVESELEKLLHSFERYYNVKTNNVEKPFCALAEFHSHGEQYVLVKAAKVAEIDSNEYVFFARSDFLTADSFSNLAESAWNQGLAKINPYNGHRNSDITLIVLADKIDADSIKPIRKAKYYKSYKFGLYGWSSFRALAYETSTGQAVTNRRGSDLKKLVSSL